MAINRRNVLLGLGAIVGGGGALIGTGAFSSLGAARSVSVSTTGDASAFLTIEGSVYTTGGGSSDTVNLELDANGQNGATGFNKEAITKLSDVLTITNNAPNDGSTSAEVGLAAGDLSGGVPSNPSGTLKILFRNSDGSVNQALVELALGPAATDSIGNGSTQELGLGESAYLDVKIDTTENTLTSSPNSDATIDGTSGSIVLVANKV